MDAGELRIPLLDLKAQQAAIQRELDEAVLRVARSGRYILGREVENFEDEWAAYCGARHCVGTANALDAMRMVLMAWGIGAGDEVIVPANTYIATWLAVSHVGARPVPVEPRLDSQLIDVERIEAAITPRTRAILPVHLYGHPCGMDAIMALADHRGLYVLDDAAQAHGAQAYCHAREEIRRVGALADASAFSFYPSKNLGALGDAGAVTTNDGDLAAKLRRLRHYGGAGRVDHQVRGINSRLDEIQAAVLRVKLKHLERMNMQRVLRANAYLKALAGVRGLGLPMNRYGAVWHQFVIRVRERDRVQAALAKRGVDTHVHYPVPPHLEGAYADLGFGPGSFPLAEQLAREVLSLPIGYHVGVEWIAGQVAEVMRETVEEAAHA